MTVLNHIPLDALCRLPIAEIASLPAEELARLQKEADAALRQAKLILACLDGALTQKYADRAKAARADAQKDFGVARFQDGAVTVVADLSKKVEWNQGKRDGWLEQGLLAVAVDDTRLTWPERELLKQLGERIYGKRRPTPDRGA